MEFQQTPRKQPTVSIVPLIDILVTLLFFVIVAMNDLTKKTPRPEIQVTLPSAHSLKVKTTESRRVTLSLDKDGMAELDGLRVPDGFLKQYLISSLEVNSGVKLALRVDKECPFESILHAHSTALEAGYLEKDIYYLVNKDQSAQ